MNKITKTRLRLHLRKPVRYMLASVYCAGFLLAGASAWVWMKVHPKK